MKAIVVKYFGPSETKGSRLRVSAEGVPSMTVSYDHGAHDPKLEAAQAFCAKHEWSGAGLVEGVLPNGDAVFVFNFPRANSRTNAEGLTFQEWFAATGRNDTASPYDLRAAWRAGEDPTEYRVSK